MGAKHDHKPEERCAKDCPNRLESRKRSESMTCGWCGYLKCRCTFILRF